MAASWWQLRRVRNDDSSAIFSKNGTPCAGKLHARFDVGGVVNMTSSLLYPF